MIGLALFARRLDDRSRARGVPRVSPTCRWSARSASRCCCSCSAAVRDRATRRSTWARCSRSKRFDCCSRCSSPAIFARRWELLRQVRTETVRDRRLPDWINLPRLDHVLPVVAGVACGAGPVLLSEGSRPGAAAVADVPVAVRDRARRRVARGRRLRGPGRGFRDRLPAEHLEHAGGAPRRCGESPWDNAVRGGDQVAQGLWGLAAGAIERHGRRPRQHAIRAGGPHRSRARGGRRRTRARRACSSSARRSRSSRGAVSQIARRASSDYRFFLAIALTLSLAIPVLVMAAGILGLLPLTGVVTPFLSYGGSAMVANFVALGLLVTSGEATAPREVRPHRGSGSRAVSRPGALARRRDGRGSA